MATSEIIVKTNTHTLFTTEIDERHDEVGESPNGKIIYELTPERYYHRLYVGYIDGDDRKLHGLYDAIYGFDSEDSFIYIIGSNGGSVDAGFYLIDSVNARISYPISEVKSHAYSMAALVFLSAKKRIGNPNSVIMLHDYSTVVSGKGGVIRDHSEFMKNRFTSKLEEYVALGYITSTELVGILNGKDLWIDADSACKRGMITNMRVGMELITTLEYLNPKDEIKYTLRQQVRQYFNDNDKFTSDDVVEHVKGSKTTVANVISTLLKEPYANKLYGKAGYITSSMPMFKVYTGDTAEDIATILNTGEAYTALLLADMTNSTVKKVTKILNQMITDKKATVQGTDILIYTL